MKLLFVAITTLVLAGCSTSAPARPTPQPTRAPTATPVSMIGHRGIITGTEPMAFTDLNSYRLYVATPPAQRPDMVTRMTGQTMVWPKPGQPIVVVSEIDGVYEVQSATGALWWLSPTLVRLDP